MRDVVETYLQGWKAHFFADNNGMFLVQGPELHCVVNPTFRGRWFSRTLFNRVVQPLLEEYGYCITTAFVTSPYLKTIKQFGFEETYRSSDTVYFRMTKNKWRRK